MFTAYFVVTLLAIAANTFSGVAALVHFRLIIPTTASRSTARPDRPA